MKSRGRSNTTQEPIPSSLWHYITADQHPLINITKRSTSDIVYLLYAPLKLLIYQFL